MAGRPRRRNEKVEMHRVRIYLRRSQGFSRRRPGTRNALGGRSRGLELPGLRHVQIRFRDGRGISVPKEPNDAVVIIGTGLAGYGTAREFRKSDPAAALTLITSDEGTYYSKPQLS